MFAPFDITFTPCLRYSRGLQCSRLRHVYITHFYAMFTLLTFTPCLRSSRGLQGSGHPPAPAMHTFHVQQLVNVTDVDEQSAWL